jgi:hypothetical protein
VSAAAAAALAALSSTAAAANATSAATASISASASASAATASRLAALAAELEAQLAPPPLADLATMGAGYALLGFLAALWVVLVCAWQVGLRGPAAAASAVAAGVPALGRQAAGALRTALLLSKVVVLLAVELGGFPLACGWWLDVCTLRLFGATLPARRRFAAAAPLTAASLHWLAGIAYMLHVSAAVAALRDALRPGVLAFLRDPADPAFDPFRDLVREPLRRHAARVAASAALYGVLVVGCVWAPVAAAGALAPGVLPLRSHAGAVGNVGSDGGDALASFALDVLLAQIVLPLAMRRLRPRALGRAALRGWLRATAGRLRLARFLLPPADPAARAEAARAEALAAALQPLGGDDIFHDADATLHPAAGDEPPPPLMPLLMPMAQPVPLHLLLPPQLRPYVPSRFFAARLTALMVCAWATLLACAVAALLAPLVLGRALLAAVRAPPAHDAYAAAAGAAALWVAAACAAGGRAAAARHGSGCAALRAAARRAAHAARAALLAAAALALVPFLLGLLFELVVAAPLRPLLDAAAAAAAASSAAAAAIPATANTTDVAANATAAALGALAQAPAAEGAARTLTWLDALPVLLGAGPEFAAHHGWAMGLLLLKLWHRWLLLPAPQQQRQRRAAAEAAMPGDDDAAAHAAAVEGNDAGAGHDADADMDDLPPLLDADADADADAIAAAAAAAAAQQPQAAPLLPHNARAHAHAPLLSWRARMQRLADDGVERLDAGWAARHVLLPALAALLAALGVPFFAARAACAAAGVTSAAACARAVACAYPVAGACVAGAAAGARARAAAAALHDAVRDERYLVGRHLRDFEPPAPVHAPAEVEQQRRGEDAEGHAKRE